MVLVNDLLAAGAWTVFAAVIGIFLAIVSAVLIPRIVNKLTPHMDEEREIKKGNLAVATYMGQIVAGVTIAIGIIVAAAIIAGISGP